MVLYKLIEHERTQDAPFIGALVCAPSCKGNCKSCFNQHMKKAPTLEKSSKEIIEEVKANPLNDGIILSGLEWSDNLSNLIPFLIDISKSDLQCILYTRREYDEIVKMMFDFTDSNEDFSSFELHKALQKMWIKTGPYKKDLKPKFAGGVKLASKNQDIWYNISCKAKELKEIKDYRY